MEVKLPLVKSPYIKEYTKRIGYTVMYITEVKCGPSKNGVAWIIETLGDKKLHRFSHYSKRRK